MKDRWYYIFVRLEPLQFNHPCAIFVIPTTEISSFLFASCEYVESPDIRIETIAYANAFVRTYRKTYRGSVNFSEVIYTDSKNIVEFSNRSMERFSRIVIAIRS